MDAYYLNADGRREIIEPLRVDGIIVPKGKHQLHRLNRSDAKITVRSVKLDFCTVHLEWAHNSQAQ